MKRFISMLLPAYLACSSITAQTARTDYFLQNSYSRQDLNPAFIPRQGFVGLPLLTSLGVESGTNAMYLKNLVFDRSGEKVTFMHPSVTSQEFLRNIPATSNTFLGIDCRILSFGFFTKNGSFWSFGLGTKSMSDVSIPKGFFELMKQGFTADEVPVNYTIRDLHISGRLYTEATVGYARTFMDGKLQAGAKAKLIFGMIGLDMRIDAFDVSVKKDLWTARSKASIQGSGVKTEYDENGLLNTIRPSNIRMGNLGFGLDLGGVYSISDRIRVSLAAVDLGLISWGGGSSVELRSPENTVSVVPGRDDVISGGIRFGDDFNESIDAIRESLNFHQVGDAGGRTTWLRTKLNAGVEYDVLPGNLSAGLLSSTFVGLAGGTELTVSANYNPARLKWFSAALSYSLLRSRANGVGLAVHLAPVRIIHLFITGDYFIPKVNGEFLPVSSKAVNIQFGVAIPVGKQKEN